MQVQFSDGSYGQYEDNALAAGIEGEIFRATDGRSVVKLYHANQTKDVERKRRIDKLINEFNPTRNSLLPTKFDPYWAEFFTWPEKRVIQPKVGFRMRFAGGLKTLDHYILPKSYSRLNPNERGWFIGRIAVAIKLATAANRMSSMGLSYPDFSGKNILVDPSAGRMVLIDCDSLTVPGQLSPTTEGTSWYRAPEIVMRSVKLPSVLTDRHALAVILYQWLLLWHPLRGDRKLVDDPDRDDQLCFGQEALYIEHPTNSANRASKQVLTSNLLGPELKELFQTAFVHGLHNPDKRPQPFQWQRALHHVYDHIIPCSSPYCDWRFFVASYRPSVISLGSLHLICPRCRERVMHPQTLPFMYLLDDHRTDHSNAHYVVGWPKRPLHRWHVRADATSIYTDATSVPDPRPYAVFGYDEASQQWYLQNETLTSMRYIDATGVWKPWPIKKSIPLVTSMSIRFGNGPEYFRARIMIEKVT